MSSTEILQQALALPEKERAFIVSGIIESLGVSEVIDEQLLAAESLRREHELESGLEKELTHDEFVAGIDLKGDS